MTKKYILFMILLLSGNYLFSQKKTISNESYKNWPKLGNADISNDGKYVWYDYISESGARNLVLSTSDGKHKQEFPNAIGAVFTINSKYLIFKSEEGIAILRIADRKIEYIKDTYNYISPQNNNNEWISYRIKNNIVLRNILTDEEEIFSNATSGHFNEQGSIFVVGTSNGIIWLSLNDKRRKTISHQKSQSLEFDPSGKQLVFMVLERDKHNIYLYKDGMDSAYAQAINIPNNAQYSVASITPNFSHDGKLLFFKLEIADSLCKDLRILTDKVNVWHYKDAFLQSNQLINANFVKTRKFTALLELATSKISLLENRSSQIVGMPTNHYAILCNIANTEEAYWNHSQTTTYTLISFKDNSLKKITSNSAQSAMVSISPSEKFVLWYDTLCKQYLSYEIATGNVREITKYVPFPMFYDYATTNRPELFATKAIGWLANDTAVLVSDQFDIWQLDPRMEKKPICITNGFGRANNIIFKLAAIPSNMNTYFHTDAILLTALNETSKHNGFYRIKLGNQADPIPVGKMIEGVYYYPGLTDRLSAPIKAENADIYIIRRMSTFEAPNLYTTKDFNKLTPISDFKPNSPYNWLTATLINFKLDDTQNRSGILYKPEDFDSAKRYPIIFHYYEKKSDELFVFLNPDLSRGGLDIPWYVSNGYLVFVPDIYYRTGHVGEDILNSIVAAVRHLSNYKWVDTSKMGLQGHSFGGYETNYLVTHNNMFKAAQASAGMSDITRNFGDLGFGEISLARLTTIGQVNMGVTPWQDPMKYINNSPIYSVSNTTTPLLLMHNKSDNAVSFEQSVALFSALRMLQKPVWLLQYDGEGHALEDISCRLDFTIRQQQFFNHYLKEEPMPQWMSEGIPSIFKGIQSGFSFEKKSENQKARSLEPTNKSFQPITSIDTISK